ncbi:MAG: hypothetical protein GYB31_03705 [Bacteroidetes bacterium]|nr:hypothetical protein [Bacteroidota bacterium]
MNRIFMVEFALPAVMTEEFMQRIPAQRAMVDKLMAEGNIKAYSLALDRSKLWTIMRGESEFEIMETIARFPLVDFMDPDISELSFHNSEDHVLQFSLN